MSPIDVVLDLLRQNAGYASAILFAYIGALWALRSLRLMQYNRDVMKTWNARRDRESANRMARWDGDRGLQDRFQGLSEYRSRDDD